MEGSRLVLNSFQLAVYSLVIRFVERQQLVLAALSEIRPDLLDTAGQKAIRPTKEYIKLTQSGYWGKDREWRYFIHGRGCRLIHTATREPIEWNAPDLQRFDPYWFVNWVNWLRAQEVEDNHIRIINSQCKGKQDEDVRSFVFNVLDQLQKEGVLLLHPDCSNRYELATSKF
jgi:hypothetical protein